MKNLEFGSRIGFLGGGQLARMLCLSAHSMGLEPWVLASDPAEPATQVCKNSLVAGEDALKRESYVRFLRQVSTVLFENEFIDVELLKWAASQVTTHEVKFLPDLKVFFELQDKLRQKKLLNRLQIKTADYQEIGPQGVSLEAIVARWSKAPSYPFVLKWAQKGYDGKGTWLSPERLKISPKTVLEQMKKFVEASQGPVYVESKIPFVKELALISARNLQGEITHYPLVISNQEAGICRSVQGPATRLGVDKQFEAQAQEIAAKIGTALEIVGVFAIEFFLTPEGELLVNEMAPRVHNSGHFTLNGSATSQFENHIRGCLGMTLGSTASAPSFAMLNVLPKSLAMPKLPTELPEKISIHWYGKSEARVGRKMGHLNWVDWSGSSVSDGMKQLETINSKMET